MNKDEKTDYAKRSQKEYSLSVKLQVINEIERRELSTTKKRLTKLIRRFRNSIISDYA